MKKNLKYFFELPNVFKLVNQYMDDSLNNKEVLSSFLDGSTWNNMRSNVKNRLCSLFFFIMMT